MFKKIFLFASIVSVTNVYAASNHVPDDLIYAGKPIDSLCFFTMEKAENTIDLRHCGAAQQHYTITDANQALSKKGYAGYNWKDTSSPSQGSTYYRFFPAGNHQYWVDTINNNGGSGDFTGIYLVQRKDKDTLVIKAIAAGDRCNGGIEDASEKNNTLHYSVNLTAYDIINLGKSSASLTAYDDLADCAVCCAAKAFYTAHADSSTAELDYISLNNFSSVSEMPAQGKYQVCFNKLAFSFINKKETHFTHEKLNQFAETFYGECVR